MNYSIVLTETAQADLSAIFRYIAVDLQSVQNANGQLSRIEKAIASLDQMPERYRVYDKKNRRERNMRVMPVDNYLVFYGNNQLVLAVTGIDTLRFEVNRHRRIEATQLLQCGQHIHYILFTIPADSGTATIQTAKRSGITVRKEPITKKEQK